jgi:hypothetical protein
VRCEAAEDFIPERAGAENIPPHLIPVWWSQMYPDVPWSSNPFMWAVSFKRVLPVQDLG